MYLLTRKHINMPSGFNDIQSFCFCYLITSLRTYEINIKTVTWPYYCWLPQSCLFAFFYGHLKMKHVLLQLWLTVCSFVTSDSILFLLLKIFKWFVKQKHVDGFPQKYYMCMSTRVGGGVKEWNVKNVAVEASPRHNGKCIFQHLTKPFEVFSKCLAKLITFWLYIQACEWY